MNPGQFLKITNGLFRKRFESGEYKISTPPYGYDVIDGKLIINDEEGKVVREIYKMYLSGNGLYTIRNFKFKLATC